jgi:type II secretory pathway component PulF
VDRFRYNGFDAAGSRVSGMVEAAGVDQAREQLRLRGIYVSDLAPLMVASEWRAMLGLDARRVSLAELEFFTSELSLLLANGVRIDRALEIVRRGAQRPAGRRVLDSLAQELKQGRQLSVAAARWPEVFDALYVNLLALGEASGRLPEVFRSLAEDLSYRRELRQKIISAVTYPAVILSVCVVALLFIFNYVVPNLSTLFADFPELPWYTQALMNVSDFMQSYQWLLLGALGVGAVLAWNIRRWPPVQRGWQEFAAGAPGLGAAVTMVERIRFAGGMSMMLEAGIPVDQGLQLASGSVESAPVRRELAIALEKLRRGESLSGVLRETRLFPDFYASLLEVGEESGALAAVFGEVARRSRMGFSAWTQRLTSLLEPLLILFMGALVGAVVVVIMLSITSITDIAF